MLSSENLSKSLPKNWVLMKLDNICEILDRERIPVNVRDRDDRIAGKDENQLFPYYGATGQVGWIDDYLFEGEHILLGEDGAPFLDAFKDKAYIVNGLFWVNNHAHILKSYGSNKFLCHYLNQIDYGHFVTGTTRLKLNQASMKQIPVKVPPLPEQQQIVAKIEELFSELDNGIESLKRAREQLKTYRQAVLKYAFEGKLTKEWRTQQIQVGNPPEAVEKLLEQIKTEREKHYQKQLEDWKKTCELAEADGKKKPAKPKKPKGLPPLTENDLAELPELPEGWCWMRFGQIVNNLKRGPFGSAIKKEYFVPKGIKVYEQKNAIYKSETIGDYFISDEKFKELSGFDVNAGDYIVSCSGTIGRIFRLPENSAKGIINQALLRIRISEKLLDHKFFQNLFESTYFQIKILKDTKGSAMVNLAGIKELELVPFAYCSLKEQNAIAQEIESRLSVCDKIEQTIEDSLKKAEALRQSILKKAFAGDLTRDWREKHPELITGENSAEKLLKRIKAEKSLAAGREKSRSKKMKKK